MRIKRAVYDLILQSFLDEILEESGGIIGAEDGIVTQFVHDCGLQGHEHCVYIPDTERLNRMINEWSQTDIQFVGLVHSHPPMGNKLSVGDLKYITSIMKCCELSVFYFPIVIPKISMTVYRACYQDEKLTVDVEKTELV